MTLTKDLGLILLAVACIAGVLVYEEIQKLLQETAGLEQQIAALESDIQTLTNELNQTYAITVIPFNVITSLNLFNATSNLPFYVNCTFSLGNGESVTFGLPTGQDFENRPTTPITCGQSICTVNTSQYFSPGSYTIAAWSPIDYPYFINGSCSLYGYSISVVRLFSSDEINEKKSMFVN